MKVRINQQERELPVGATLADAIATLDAKPPFAAAINLQFVPRSGYASQPLHEGDQIEIIVPVTGG